MSLMQELKAEITRLARREVRKELEPVKRVNAAQRGLIANLRRDVTALQREVHRLQRQLGKDEPVVQEEPAKAFWISGRGVVSLRKRLGLTQAELARLAGVSTQSVVNWEKIEGKIPFRQEMTLLKLKEIGSMSKTKAWTVLGKD